MLTASSGPCYPIGLTGKHEADSGIGEVRLFDQCSARGPAAAWKGRGAGSMHDHVKTVVGSTSEGVARVG